MNNVQASLPDENGLPLFAGLFRSLLDWDQNEHKRMKTSHWRVWRTVCIRKMHSKNLFGLLTQNFWTPTMAVMNAFTNVFITFKKCSSFPSERTTDRLKRFAVTNLDARTTVLARCQSTENLQPKSTPRRHTPEVDPSQRASPRCWVCSKGKLLNKTARRIAPFGLQMIRPSVTIKKVANN